MERTTKLSVDVFSDAAIVAEITATSSRSSVRSSSTGAAGTAGAGAGAAFGAVSFCPIFPTYLNKEITKNQEDQNNEYTADTHNGIDSGTV